MKRLEIAIGGRIFPLKVEEEETQIILETVQEINDKLGQLQMTYASKDANDWMSMALLTYAVENRKLRDESDLSEIESKLIAIDHQLDNFIS